MNLEFVLLRILHIVGGTVWAGGAVYVAFILSPNLDRLGPDIRGSVMKAVSRSTTSLLTGAGTITIFAGIALTLRMRQNFFTTWFNSEWGWAIFTGMVISIAAIGLGGIVGATVKRLVKLSSEIEGRSPSNEEMTTMAAMSKKISYISKISAVLVIIALITMASARYL